MKKIPLLLDKPLNSPDADQFGHEHYADVLYDLITNNDLKMPYNIGLLGKWGVGKSSIKEICKKKLGEKSKNVYCIDFNAWKYGGSGIKKALLREIYLKINGSDEAIKDQFSRHITKQVMELCDNQELRKNIWNVAWNWLQIIGYNIIFCLIWKFILPNLEMWGQILSTIPLAIVITKVTKHLLDKNNMLIPVFQNITKMDVPDTTAEIYEEFLKKQLKKYKKDNKLIDKIVVFVDDIDRLPSAQEMVDGINAIRAFMDFDIEEKDNIGFVFVVSCCEYKISDALMSIKIIDDIDIESCEQQTEAKRFLDKIFHFRIDIPPFPYRDMIDYSKKILETQIPDFNDFEDQLIISGTDIENLLCRLIYPNVQNPRQAIQILNTFFQSWNIAVRRESAEMANKAGGLAKGIVTKHPLTLAVLAVIKVDFPYFYKELLLEPKLLSYILEVLRTGEPPKFYIDSKIKNIFLDFKDNKTKLKPCFYELNQYLNLINNKFELPISLKPFLLLNQNSLSRKYGEQAYDIEEALIHKSHEKLFNILNLKTNKLSVENAQLIKSVYESLSYDLYKENAFTAIIKLIPYISNDTRFLIDSFADTLYKHNKYRETLSVEDYKQLLHTVSETKIEKVISSLNKAYRTKYSYDTSSESCKQKMVLFKDASNVLLEFYNDNRDFVNNDFCSWVISPIFAKENVEDGEDFDFGFEYTYYVFQNYEFIYQYKSKEYIDTIVKEFQKDKSFITEENEAKVIQTFEKALDYILINENEEFNDICENIIGEENTKLYSYIIDYSKKNLNNFTNSNLNNYLIQLDCAIENKLNNDIKTEFSVKEQLKNFSDLLKIYFQNIEKDSYEYVDDLCKAIIPNENFTNEIIEIMNILTNNNYANISKIDELIINHVFQFEPESENLKLFLNYLFNNYNHIPIENKISFANNYADSIMNIDISSLEDSTLNGLKQYIDMILTEKNEQVATVLIDKYFDFTNGYLIPNDEKEYFEQLLCLLPILSFGNIEKVKDFIILILDNDDFAYDYSDKIGQLVLSRGGNIWNSDNRIDESYSRITTDDVNDKQLDCAINIYNTINRLQSTKNLTNLYHLILKSENIELKEKQLWLERLSKEKIYTTDEFIELIINKDSEVQDYEAIRNLNKRFLDVYTLEERKYILSKLLFNDSFTELFKIVIDIIYKITGSYTELNEIIDENSKNNNINRLLSKRMLITDMLLGKDRKEPSRILLLNTKIIEESNIENKQELTTQMLQWSYDLYNDIMRDTEVRGLSDNLKELINKIFVGKTFGKIRFRNKQ